MFYVHRKANGSQFNRQKPLLWTKLRLLRQVVKEFWWKVALPPHLVTRMTVSPFWNCTFAAMHCPLQFRPVMPQHLLLTQSNAFHDGGRTSELPLPMGAGGSRAPLNAWFLGPTRVQNPNGISIDSAIFRAHSCLQQTRQTDAHTDHTTSVARAFRACDDA